MRRWQSHFFTNACLLLIVTLSSCHTSKKTAVAYKTAKPPKFIKGMYLNGHNKSSSTANAIEPAKSVPVYVAVAKTAEPEPMSEYIEREPHERSRVISRKPRQVFEVTPTTEPIMEPEKDPDVSERGSKDEDPDNVPVATKYTDMVGLEKKDINNPQLYRFIDKWYGTNYRLGGQSERGIDCSGFAQKLYGDVYGMDLTRTAQDQYKACKRKKHPDEAEEGDLVFFKQRSKRITHVGVYLANDYFIHASTSQGVIISSLKEEYWHKHYAGVGKMLNE